MKLLEIYKAILAAAGLVVTEDNFVSSNVDGKLSPFLVGGKRLTLPTFDHQRNPDKSNMVLFHPLCENTLRGESEVMAAFRAALNANLQYVIGWLSYQLLTINGSVDLHATLTQDQHEFLSKVKQIDENTLKFLEKIMKAMPVGQVGKCFASIFVKRSGEVGGKKYARVGVVSFPLYNELKSTTSKESKEVYGVKVTRNRDRDALIALYEYLIPNVEVPGSHNVGSNDLIAPNLDALMRGFMSVAGPLNDVINLFFDKLHEPEKILFNADWVEAFGDLKELQNEIRSVPMQAGNEGAANKAMPEPIAQAAPVPVPQPAPAPYMMPMQAVPQMQPVPGFMPQPMGQQYFQQQPMQMAAPQPVRTAAGVEWGSLVHASPALAQTVNMTLMGQGMMQQNMGGRAAFGQPVQQQQFHQPQFHQPQQFAQQQFQPQGRSY